MSVFQVISIHHQVRRQPRKIWGELTGLIDLPVVNVSRPEPFCLLYFLIFYLLFVTPQKVS